jgi:hypothetical protein
MAAAHRRHELASTHWQYVLVHLDLNDLDQARQAMWALVLSTHFASVNYARFPLKSVLRDVMMALTVCCLINVHSDVVVEEN